MDVGIVEYDLRGSESLCLHLADQIGFDCMELAESAIGDSNRLLFDPIRKDRLLELVRETGVKICSVFATQFVRTSILDPDLNRRQMALLALRQVAERALAQRINVVVVPLFGASSIHSDASALAFSELLSRVAKWDDLGETRFAFKSLLPPVEMLAFLDRAASHRLGVSFDPANTSSIGRDVLADVRAYGHRLFHVHLKQRTTGGTLSDVDGTQYDIKQFLETLVEIKFAGPLVLDLPTDRVPLEAARNGLLLCRRLLAA